MRSLTPINFYLYKFNLFKFLETEASEISAFYFLLGKHLRIWYNIKFLIYIC